MGKRNSTRTKKTTRRRRRAETQVGDYRHEEATRIPPAKIAAEGTVPAVPKARYYYSPRRPPVLRFDPDGGPDKFPELLAEARRRPLTEDEAKLLAKALRTQEPWLEWAEKREQHGRGFRGPGTPTGMSGRRSPWS